MTTTYDAQGAAAAHERAVKSYADLIAAISRYLEINSPTTPIDDYAIGMVLYDLGRRHRGGGGM